MKFELTILGSSSASPTKNRYPTAHALNVRERFFLIDCGEGTQHQLMRNNINLMKINHIFISHLHGDHLFGLAGLLSTMDLDNRKHDLHIYGIAQLGLVLNDFLKYFGTNFNYKIIFHKINYRKNEVIFEDKNLTVETIPLKHRVPCSGFLFKEKEPELDIRKELIEKYELTRAEIVKIKTGCDLMLKDESIIPNSELTYKPYKPRAYAFCSDTMYNEKIVNIIKNVDLLYHEATFAENLMKMAKTTGHSTAKQAATIAKLSGAKKLIIGHFSSRYKDLDILLNEAKEVFEETYLAKEDEKFDLKINKKLS